MNKVIRKPTGYGVTANEAKLTKKFNDQIRYVQGIRTTIVGNSTTTIKVTLNSAGERLLGLSIMPVTGQLNTLADTQVKFMVNNNNLILTAAANNLNPNFVQNMIFFPVPQPLNGNDSINLEVSKNDSGDTVIITNIFYVPQI